MNLPDSAYLGVSCQDYEFQSLSQVLLCTDLWKDQKVLHAAYCDSQGVTQQFILNGMKNALLAVSRGRVQMDTKAWQYDVVVNPIKRQVCPL